MGDQRSAVGDPARGHLRFLRDRRIGGDAAHQRHGERLGGVFVVVRCDDAPTWEMLHGKGHVLSRNREVAMLWLPRHLLGLEAATSVMGAVMGEPTGGAEPAHRLDLVAVASMPLAQGTSLDAVGHHHSIAGVRAELRPPRPMASGHALPYYLVANRRLKRPVAAGAAIEFDDIELDPSSSLVRLRRKQDERFLGAAAAMA